MAVLIFLGAFGGLVALGVPWPMALGLVAAYIFLCDLLVKRQ